MLYKYLNPNLIAVGTEVTPDTKPGISIYLIDAVTGTNVFITILCYFFLIKVVYGGSVAEWLERRI